VVFCFVCVVVCVCCLMGGFLSNFLFKPVVVVFTENGGNPVYD